ncbi:PhzF family phenazine biosynthesis protein [Dysgonomonas alginatilytica]|uniref:PhzF family phenazine biosynthesis protein n=1 Tax=Dysgonomonas alginatilytica TaxID=1605892 RepID=A0A2V3PQM9_9BACT|nr:PhzF family phenazine biosynthesis protein [Dysgonomonas alginatilytica]PXV66348.1 PhzF family phenazine biosynthesis protein [Dysgonomonas alginatilytica]
MEQRIYQIDAFTDKVFSGNPAAVCPLNKWLSDSVMQKIAMENNLAETVFYVKQDNHYEIRWFTPSVEVDLCGHATLAAAFVLFNYESYKENIIHFYSPRSGNLTVAKQGELLTLNFPTDVFESIPLTNELTDVFNITPEFAFRGKTDYLLVFTNEEQIKQLIPRFDRISKLDGRGVIVTAKGDEVDFVSRFFAPQSGIAEDPVTGSAHTTLTPYWSDILGKDELTAIQLSERRGYLKCKYLNDRVEISGQARMYLKGEIYL